VGYIKALCVPSFKRDSGYIKQYPHRNLRYVNLLWEIFKSVRAKVAQLSLMGDMEATQDYFYALHAS
jgi:hypothetical protein